MVQQGLGQFLVLLALFPFKLQVPAEICMLPLEITKCHEQVFNLRVQVTVLVLGHG